MTGSKRFTGRNWNTKAVPWASPVLAPGNPTEKIPTKMSSQLKIIKHKKKNYKAHKEKVHESQMMQLMEKFKSSKLYSRALFIRLVEVI